MFEKPQTKQENIDVESAFISNEFLYMALAILTLLVAVKRVLAKKELDFRHYYHVKQVT